MAARASPYILFTAAERRSECPLLRRWRGLHGDLCGRGPIDGAVSMRPARRPWGQGTDVGSKKTIIAVTALICVAAAVFSSTLVASHLAQGAPTTVVGIDLAPDGSPANAATSLGSIETCRSVVPGQQ